MKKYVLAGCGNRGLYSYAKPIVEKYADCARLVGLYDINPKRCAYASALLGDVPCYTDFDKMLAEASPDTLIITTVDRFHSQYASKALDVGVDVICEKPMVKDDAQCRALFEAEKHSGREIAVTFNCRYIPHIIRLKELMRQGVVGKVLNVDFEWMLDTSHGADYFRRWHRKLENCGGLLVHKSTHHFDIINWLIEREPQTVYATGALDYYGHDRRPHARRCAECAEKCALRYPGANDPKIRALYFDCEDADGYFRDRCVFDGEIDIYDTMSLSVLYSGGARMSYSLIAHSPYEGWKLSISGTDGRIEASEYSSGPESGDTQNHIKIFDRAGNMRVVDVDKETGEHGGGDDRMRDMLLRGYTEDPLGQCAGSHEGAMSCLIGIAANKSIQSGMPVSIDALLRAPEA